ncbi:hypothetical protein V5E97_24625 [Singulisphaera sp. Ch08]|uniref:Uncharacterized protein n=1 Tax=Singulisphaera sp. Ch08 TaxID=3120278 RepID=A0AAU7C8P7_9BACT
MKGPMMSEVKKQVPRFHVGDWGTLYSGFGKMEARVVEDLGPIGVRGRRLYRVESKEDRDNSTTFEV